MAHRSHRKIQKSFDTRFEGDTLFADLIKLTCRNKVKQILALLNSTAFENIDSVILFYNNNYYQKLPKVFTNFSWYLLLFS